MNALKYIGVLHPALMPRYLDFLFYDELHLIKAATPTNSDSAILFDAGILRNYDHNTQLLPGDLSDSEVQVFENIARLNSYRQSQMNVLDTAQDHYFPPDFPSTSDPKVDYFAWRRDVGEQIVSVDKQFLTPATQAGAIMLNQQPMIQAVAICPEPGDIRSAYGQFVEGYAWKFLEVGVPSLPIRDLVKFKYDNQDKLRRLRLAIHNAAKDHNDFEFVIEEISLALTEYNNAVKTLKQKFELEILDLRLSLPQKLAQFLISFDTSVFHLSTQLKKVKIEEEIALANLPGREAAYLYEIGRFINQELNTRHQVL